MSLLDWLLRRNKRPAPLQWEPTPTFPRAIITDDGRRHLVEVPYLLPKDLPEANRLNFQHYFLKTLLGGLYAAPLQKDITDILDIGCGTGIWAREMAKDFPSARVVGMDLEPPEYGDQGALEGGNVATLSNCCFVRGNILERLSYNNESFDFVHQRLLIAAIPANRWQAVVHELARVTRRGGWVELFEMSASYHNTGPAQQQFLQWGNIAAKKARGIDYAYALRLQELLLHAGLKEVKARTFCVPIGSWGGHAGRMLAQNTLEVYKTLGPLFQQQLGISSAQFAAVIAALPQEWESYQTKFDVPFAYGQV